MKTFNSNLRPILKHQQMLTVFAVFCVCLLLVRAKMTHTIFYFFLIWNLFLAYVPLALSGFISGSPAIIQKRRYFYPLCLAWLLLLPNAPYIITDFIHLKRESTVPVWFDVLLLISFSVNGLLFGLASMKQVFNTLAVKFSFTTAWTAMAFVCLLSAFGIYLGRFLRYNSWDIFHKPLKLIADIFLSLTAAETYKPAWGITLGFGTLLFLLFHLYNQPEK